MFKTFIYKPFHILCQLGSGLYDIGDAKAMFFITNFEAKPKSGGKGS